MTTFHYCEMKERAQQQLSRTPQARTVLLTYTGILIGLSVLTLAFSELLSLRISQSGGLGNLGSRSTLSALQTMLPIIRSMILVCLEVGYLNAMLRVSRGQYVSRNSLRLGFDRFWVLLRMSIIQLLIISGAGFASAYIAVFLYMLTPMSQGIKELLIPLISESSILSNQAIVIDEALYAQMSQALLPAMLLCGVVFCIIAFPLLYRYRMAHYVIIEKPGIKAIAALRESRMMMKGHRMELLKLDLRLWPYYVGTFLATLVSYADMLFSLLGISLGISSEVMYYLSYAAYLGVMFLVYYYLRNQVEVVYALAYDAVKPQPPKEQGVVLGSIFNV